ncbi:MAG TPA: hypothetical protein VE127_05295, partial [Solirubrobacteraceae bacterium]|nr:hypothetical protein [Solirubrobacteraceae bacterium]
MRATALLCPDEARPWTSAVRALVVGAVFAATMSFAPLAAARSRRCADAHIPIARTSRAALQRAVVC